MSHVNIDYYFNMLARNIITKATELFQNSSGLVFAMAGRWTGGKREVGYFCWNAPNITDKDQEWNAADKE